MRFHFAQDTFVFTPSVIAAVRSGEVVMHEVFWYFGAACLAVIVVYLFGYVLGGLTGSKTAEGQETRISASRLGLVFSDGASDFQHKYYLRKVYVSGKITSSKVVHEQKHQVLLDGVILCEFNSVQDWVKEGIDVEISGLCLGKILTGCEAEQGHDK